MARNGLKVRLRRDGCPVPEIDVSDSQYSSFYKKVTLYSISKFCTPVDSSILPLQFYIESSSFKPYFRHRNSH